MRLSEKGVERYNKLTTNRPKLICSATDKTTAIDKIQVSGDYIFECSETLAKIYFPQFLGEAEILEPRELRLWIKEQFEEASRVYKP